ncbi:MAG TPA: peptide ABC transporter substrate-binding protein [Candidatus Cybelea sp.]|jgi:peptide/nickel transport system substrate-binding protein|nr:peptide ABC transporter substrate-binding protein [Candidatus Cybelea sp.]
MTRTSSALALAAVMGLVGCTKASNEVAAGARHPWTRVGVLRIAIQSDVKNLNPLLNSNTTDGFIANLLFEPLLAADARGNPVPMLATGVPSVENGGISRAGLAVTYHLRRNAKWTDGQSVTSKDVKWSWQAIMNPNNNVVSRHGYDYVKSIDTPDDYTVVVHLKQKFSPFVNTFFAMSDQPFPVAPAHVLAKYPDINQVPFDSAPNVSDGPFRFVEWAHGDHITLERNDAFFMGKPGLSRIEIRIIPDENTSVNLMKTHGIDFMFQASPETYPALKPVPDIKLAFVNVNGYERAQINTSRPYLRDPNVRLAIAYAIDKKQLVDTLTYGQMTEATEDIPDWLWAFNPHVRSYPHDVAMSRRLLRGAGWTPGPDGIMRKNGQTLELVLVTNNSNVTRRQASVELQAMLREAGIGVEIKSFPGEVLFAPAGMGGILQLGKFDLSVNGWYAGIDPDNSAQYMCQNVPPGGYNYSRFCNPQMQAAEVAALTHYERAERTVAYYETQELLARYNPEIFFWWRRQMEPISVDFKGFDPNPVLESWNAWQWTI